MLLEKNNKLLFIGDSITDCDRRKPEGEGGADALGRGYVSFVNAFLQSAYPELSIRVVNQGINGHTVRDLEARWQRDVVDHRPDWLSIMIGINDVWRQYDNPYLTEKHVYLDEYRERLEKLVVETKPLVKGLVLMTPFFIESSKEDAMLQSMNEYGAVVKELAEKHDCVFVDTQAAIDKVLGDLHSSALAWDRVHPSATGHMLLARAFLNEIGFNWGK
ncbi:MAG: SGNH/GDSL hydrolase family protein [Bacillus sp. (in: Bacteria)]|nr:SGNH/GDSL hydrolase family protein [Bacillus sp. (in: firmicutes)]